MVRKFFLVIGATGLPRVVQKQPKVGPQEIAYPLEIKYPDGWGSIVWKNKVVVEMPDPPEGFTPAVRS